MKKSIRWAVVLPAALILAVIAMGCYVGPQEVLFLKGSLAGPSYWDMALINMLEFGWDYGKIYRRHYGKPSAKWGNPILLEQSSMKVSIRFIFESNDDLGAFDKLVRSKSTYFNSHRRELFEEAKKAEGLIAIVLETLDSRPIVVLEKSRDSGKCEITWRDPLFFLEIREITGNKDLSV